MICYKLRRNKPPRDEVFTQQELDAYKDKIARPYIDVIHVNNGVIPITNPVWDLNACPFLNEDYTCNLMK